MSMLVRKCPKCSKLFWKKEEEVEYADENTLKVVCNHCHQILRIPLMTQGATAGAPKMGPSRLQKIGPRFSDCFPFHISHLGELVFPFLTLNF